MLYICKKLFYFISCNIIIISQRSSFIFLTCQQKFDSTPVKLGQTVLGFVPKRSAFRHPGKHPNNQTFIRASSSRLQLEAK